MPDSDGLTAKRRIRDRIVRSMDSGYRTNDRRSQLECMSQGWVGRRHRRMSVLKGRPDNGELLNWLTVLLWKWAAHSRSRALQPLVAMLGVH